MTLYEKFATGKIDLIEYHTQAEKVLMNAINETLKENLAYTYYWVENELKDSCDLNMITETNNARKSVEDALKCFRGKIDRDNLNMVLLSTVMDEEDFKNLYLTLNNPVEKPNHKRFINVETSNSICSVVAASATILKCQSTVGVVRNNNEDFAVSIISPTNDKIKLLLICDGMGGYDGGELASKYTAKKIVTWFNRIDFNNIDFNTIDEELKKLVMNIHKELQNLFVSAGTTLTAAIIGEEETLIANIGDSRAYTISHNKLYQLTEDDSSVWRVYYKNDDFFDKDDLRFLRGNNQLEDCLGNVGAGKIKTFKIVNKSYDGLLLTSDGITDILSDKKMSLIFKESFGEDYIKKLLHEACYGTPESIGFEDDIAFQPTYPGKDNASATMYLKFVR